MILLLLFGITYDQQQSRITDTTTKYRKRRRRRKSARVSLCRIILCPSVTQKWRNPTVPVRGDEKKKGGGDRITFPAAVASISLSLSLFS
jgi:hypothetical protein